MTGTAPIAARNPLRYRAYYLDTETGLYYLPARYYDPATARFLSPDPAPPSAGDPGSLNAYAYCGDDPVGASDPSGAITLWDDDNHVDRYELDIHNATHSRRDRGKWLARAKNHFAEWVKMMAERRASAARSLNAVAMDAFYGANRGANGAPPGEDRDGDALAAGVVNGLAIAANVAGIAIGVTCVGLAIAGTGGAALLVPAIIGATASTVGMAVTEYSYKKGWCSKGERDVGLGLGWTGLALCGIGAFTMPSGVATAVAMQSVSVAVVGAAVSVAGAASRWGS
ncbi:rhs family protein [Coriobacteriaceae bacterium EMTCatB1]|nr:rhs family protein [Coriobacteriaceae bacterium EMTCatB1]